MRYIILIVDNFSKFVGLYPAKSSSTLEFVKMFLSWVGIFGAENSQKRWRVSIHVLHSASTQGTLKYHHIVVVAYHPQANSMAEREDEGGINTLFGH